MKPANKLEEFLFQFVSDAARRILWPIEGGQRFQTYDECVVLFTPEVRNLAVSALSTGDMQDLDDTITRILWNLHADHGLSKVDHHDGTPATKPAAEMSQDELDAMLQGRSIAHWWSSRKRRDTAPNENTAKPQANAPTMAPQAKEKPPSRVEERKARIIAVIERIEKQDQGLDRNAMPGIKSDFFDLCKHLDKDFFATITLGHFDKHLEGLCKFKQGARSSDYYRKIADKLG